MNRDPKGWLESRFALLAAAIFLIAFVARAIPLARTGFGWAMGMDSATYIQLAHGLSAGCGFARLEHGTCGTPEVERTPGYPAFLARAGSLRSALLIQALVASLVCLVICVFVRSRWGAATGLLAGLLLALDIASIHASTQLLTDSLFQSLVVVGAILEVMWLRRIRTGNRAPAPLLGAGVAFALATLMRPIGQFLVLPAAALPLLATSQPMKRRLAQAALAAGIPLMVICGWVARNSLDAGVSTFSSIAAYNLYYFRAATVVAEQDGMSFSAAQRVLAAKVGENNTSAVGNTRVLSQLQHRALLILLEHPLQTAEMTGEGFGFLLIAPDRLPFADVPEHGHEPGPLRVQAMLDGLTRSPGATLQETFRTEFGSSIVYVCLAVLQVVFALAMLAGALIALRRGISDWNAPGTAEILFLASVALLMLILASGPEASARLRLPAVPFIAILAAVGWVGRIGKANEEFSGESARESAVGR